MYLVFSPDDDGYYWERRYTDWATSQVFATEEAAFEARANDTIIWDFS